MCICAMRPLLPNGAVDIFFTRQMIKANAKNDDHIVDFIAYRDDGCVIEE